MNGLEALASRIAALLSVDPKGLGGVWLRARHGPFREAMIAQLKAIPGAHGRVMPEAGGIELFGGIDLTQSLFSGHVVARKGVLDASDVLWLTRAERMQVGMAGRVATAMDSGLCGTIILADESSEVDEMPPSALRDRLAFFLSDQMECPDGAVRVLGRDEIEAARLRIGGLVPPDDLLELAVRITEDLGCRETRPALFLVRAARAIAALEDAAEVNEGHLGEATRLVMPHRARLSAEVEETEPQPRVDESEEKNDAGGETREDALRDILLDAASVSLPGDLLAHMVVRDRRAAGSGHGAERTSHTRGRPLPSRPGKPDGRARLDLLATLQAAAPWQKLRNAPPGRLAIRREDLRVRRYRERSERVLIFVVDASGSAAMARLAEAKGAAEALLSEAYRSRDHVSLITFRGDDAECVLEPTRSLVRAKRLLGGLPGGGTTPLAAALRQSAEQAGLARTKGLTPQIILMTDGRANKALDGSTARETAREDAIRMARWLRLEDIPALVVDSGLRPSADLTEIARILGAETIRLPKGHKASSSEALLAALEH
ncbi:VWA domain-containing protein [Silicimonas sp. MF1-12-2]|uniref:VWA domain-containing protein n=1 Tax=Silicimonas sp. MF1-12-2 TaxID=3384793 RepID=UPI0039B54570